MERELQKLTWSQVKALVPEKINTVLIPVGTVEAHGAAALGTDNFIPKAIAMSQAKKLNALIAPTLNYGITKSLYRYPGSFTIRPETYKNFIGEIIDSLADHDFKYIIFINGHGGNNSMLKEAAYEKHIDRKVGIAAIHWWELTGDLNQEIFGDAGGHAGNNETACVQAIDEALVNKDEFTKDMGFHMKRGADIYPVPGSILLYEENQGYPTFDAAQSKEYLDKMSEIVGDFIVDIINRWNNMKLF
ncbi:MAG: creatininase family protein [candidate division Zixibacteria bacterium]